MKLNIMKNFKKKLLIICISLILLGILGGFSPSDNKTSKKRDILVIAHRGYHVQEVENTIASLKAAAKYKPDYVELDVVESADGVPFVIHDNNLRGLAGVDKNIRELKASEIKTLVIRGSGKTDKIPTLREFIQEAKKLNQKLLIEIKIYGGESPNYVGNITSLMKELGVTKEYRVQSMDLNALYKVMESKLDIVTGYIARNKDIDLNSEVFNFLSIPNKDVAIDVLNQKLIFKKEVYVWTVDGEEDIKNAFFDNADGVITNRCDKAVNVRRKVHSEIQ